jgi:hypothetical protein
MSARAGMEIRFDRVGADATIAVKGDGFFRLCRRHRRTQKTGQSEGGSRSSSHYTCPGDTHPGGDMALSLGRKHDGIGLNPGRRRAHAAAGSGGAVGQCRASGFPAHSRPRLRRGSSSGSPELHFSKFLCFRPGGPRFRADERNFALAEDRVEQQLDVQDQDNAGDNPSQRRDRPRDREHAHLLAVRHEQHQRDNRKR